MKKYTIVFMHPNGDIYVKNRFGQELWLKDGRYKHNKDGTVSRK